MTADTASLLVFRYTEAVYGKKSKKKIDWYCGHAPFVVCEKPFRQNAEIKNAPKVHNTKNNPIWLKFHLKSFQTSTSQMRKKNSENFIFIGPFTNCPMNILISLAEFQL